MAKHGLWTRAVRRVYPLAKRMHWALRTRQAGEPRILFVCGAAKSGKSLLCSLLERDLRVTVFREDSAISGRDGNRLRFKSDAEIRDVFARSRAPIVVSEAKVESQNVARLLEAFPGSHVAWVWRGVEGAVAADLIRFKSQRENVAAVVKGDPSDWRAERASTATREVLRQWYAPDMPVADASALFWYARNMLWFDQQLDQSPRALLVRYEEFCRSPDTVLASVYASLGVSPPALNASAHVHSDMVRAGVGQEFAPEIWSLCSALSARLTTSAHRAATVAAVPRSSS